MNVTRAVVVTAAVLVIGLVGLGAYAFAQSDGFGPPWRDGAGWHDGTRGRGGWHGGGADPERIRELRGDLAADLAAQLDTSGEAIETAMRRVVAQRLEDAAAQGRLDPAEVDEALAAYDDGEIWAVFKAFAHDADEATESP